MKSDFPITKVDCVAKAIYSKPDIKSFFSQHKYLHKSKIVCECFRRGGGKGGGDQTKVLKTTGSLNKN